MPVKTIAWSQVAVMLDAFMEFVRGQVGHNMGDGALNIHRSLLVLTGRKSTDDTKSHSNRLLLKSIVFYRRCA